MTTKLSTSGSCGERCTGDAACVLSMRNSHDGMARIHAHVRAYWHVMLCHVTGSSVPGSIDRVSSVRCASLCSHAPSTHPPAGAPAGDQGFESEDREAQCGQLSK